MFGTVSIGTSTPKSPRATIMASAALMIPSISSMASGFSIFAIIFVCLFFLVINFFKLPFQIIYWKNITLSSLYTDLLLLPALVLGFWAGIKIVAKIRDESYRKIVIALTLAGAIVMFLKR